MGIVTQDTILFNDTIKHNICYGSPNAKLADIKFAAEAANAITASKLQVYGNPIVNIVNIEDNIEVPFYALPLDQNGVFVSGVSISFEMLNETPGYLSEATLISDSSAVEQKFNVVPL